MSLGLCRRKTQLDLLAIVCARRAQARVALPTSTPVGDVPTRFLALEPDRLLLAWPPGGTGGIPVSGARVDVFFVEGGVHYALVAETRGRDLFLTPKGASVAAWVLSVPLRVEQRQQREHFRVSLADLPPVEAVFTATADGRSRFRARLSNISKGGLGAVAWCVGRAEPEVGETYWVDFQLPGLPDPFEFVVRVVHVRPGGPSGGLVIGGVFCAGDDGRMQRGALQRIEAFVLSRERALLRRAVLHAGWEGGPC